MGFLRHGETLFHRTLQDLQGLLHRGAGCSRFSGTGRQHRRQQEEYLFQRGLAGRHPLRFHDECYKPCPTAESRPADSRLFLHPFLRAGPVQYRHLRRSVLLVPACGPGQHVPQFFVDGPAFPYLERALGYVHRPDKRRRRQPGGPRTGRTRHRLPYRRIPQLRIQPHIHPVQSDGRIREQPGSGQVKPRLEEFQAGDSGSGRLCHRQCRLG